MSSSREGTDAFAGDCGSNSAACAVGTTSADGAASDTSTAEAEGISVFRAAAVASGVVAAATSGKVEGSETGASGVDRFQGVQDRFRDDMAAKGDIGAAEAYIIGLLPRATYEGWDISIHTRR
jgi:hypothetical protein